MPHSIDKISGRESAQPLRISEQDLRAYVEGRLDAARRTEISGFLACNPDIAAEVMQAMHHGERMQAFSATATAAKPPQPRQRTARIIAACAACALAGWTFATGLDEDGPLQGLLKAPEYVEDAVMSWRATHLRIAMRSQMQTPVVDTEELLHTMQLRLPPLPAEWQLLDAQVYPSEAGPGISVLMQLAPGRQLNLFAVRSNTAASATPEVTTRMGAHAAYWEVEGAAYVLTGDGSRAEILAEARQLSRRGLL